MLTVHSSAGPPRRSCPRRRSALEPAADLLRALPHGGQPEPVRRGTPGVRGRRRPPRHPQLAVLGPHPHGQPTGAGVPGGVGHRLRGDPVAGDVHGRRQRRQVLDVDRDVQVGRAEPVASLARLAARPRSSREGGRRSSVIDRRSPTASPSPRRRRRSAWPPAGPRPGRAPSPAAAAPPAPHRRRRGGRGARRRSSSRAATSDSRACCSESVS